MLSFVAADIEILPLMDGLRLEELHLEKNRLTTLEGLPRSLKHLYVCENKITGDGLCYSFPSLESFHVSDNPIRDCDAQTFRECFPSLKVLHFDRCRLRKIEFLRGSHIEELMIQYNPISVLAGIPQRVRILKAYGCGIRMIQSKIPQTIEHLELGSNSLGYAGLPLNWSSCLRELHLDNNFLEKFPRNLPDSLNTLTLNNNKITEIPRKLPESLRILFLNYNRIRKLPDFQGHRRFTILLLDDNMLTDMPDSTCSQILSYRRNWSEAIHHRSQQFIRNCWKRHLLRLRLRQYRRTQRIKKELFEISMIPERWRQIDTYDSSWI